MTTVSVTINGRQIDADIDDRALLLDLVREEAGLTGTHAGCMEARCGTCTVLVGGQAVKSCNVLALQVDGSEITTIEGLSATALADGNGQAADDVPLGQLGLDPALLHPVQAAFRDHGAVQCGFCTSGFILTLVQYLTTNPDPSEAEIREAIRGNMCRCTGYQKIVEAALDAAGRLRGEPQTEPAPS